ncbi:DNA polymerase III subunit delta [Tepidibacillus fermentans]|uniref:DNA polymerase III subunit delta n=1 Tax=Tepidibacillus fermentans TaxID=1281767 RepID=A0A4R3KKJ6_9BACI|nr:DNA polymerase III subunit delta [Tepidibacillus fermentans]TCS83771.1 DNA polymerase III delta subunit [Tepidibacillus fermentans]
MPKSSIYLFYGLESYLIEQKIEQIIHQRLPFEEREMNLITYDLQVTPIEEVIQEAETLPFLSEHKVVIAKNAYFLTGQKANTKVEHEIESLERFLENPVDYSTLILTVFSEKLDERKKITKILKQAATVESFATLKGKELADWIHKIAQTEGIEISSDAAQFLIYTVGEELQILNQEIKKMALYVGKGGKIDQKVVKELTARTLEQNVFSLVEQVANLEIDQAIRMLYDLLKNKEEPIKIVALLAKQFRLMLFAKELSQKGYSNQQIGNHIGVHPYAVQLALQQGRGFSEQELKGIIKKLAEMDFEMKTGKKDKVLALELFLLSLTRMKSK